jgi:hypothetical protein
MRISSRNTRRAMALVSVAGVATVALSGIAYADNIQDDIVDTGAGVLLVAGSPGTATANLKVVGNSSDGATTDPGCNWDTGEQPLVLDVVTPAGVTASPDPVSITACGADVPVTFTAGAAAVSGTASVRIVSSPAGSGGYNNQVSIPITITQPAPTNTPPQVSVTGVTDGATYETSQVPQPSCAVVDLEDTTESATPTVTGGPADALGSHTVTCSYTDSGSLTRSASATYVVVRDRDTTPPVIAYTLDPAQPDGDDGWYAEDVTLTWTVVEQESPETLELTGCQERTIDADQAAATYTCTATSEGGSASERSAAIRRDGTAPSVSYDGVTAGTPGSNGWYTSPVTAAFTATDALSGPSTASRSVTSIGDGAAVVLASPAFTDAAGNTTPAGAALSPAFKIDSQAPNAPMASVDPAPNGDGWNNHDVTVSFAPAGDHGPSGVDSCTADVTVDVETASRTVSGTCTDVAGNVSTTRVVTVKLDKTRPTISDQVTVQGVEGANGWFTSDVEVTFEAQDELSGPAQAYRSVTSSGEGVAVVVTSPTFTDRAGNEAETVTRTYRIDKSAPTDVTFAGLADYYFGDAQTPPTCTARDAVSGLASCQVSGGGTATGTQTWTATATDNAGHTTTATATYQVKPWTTRGFFAPVDMGGVYNTVKGGSTVPLKFELFSGSTELTSTSAIRSFTTQKVGCTSGSEDAIEELGTTGGTSLRYDATAGQFIQNWKTPAGSGTCYRATMNAADGSSISALFKLK